MSNRSRIFQTLVLIFKRDIGRYVKEHGNCPAEEAADIMDEELQKAGFTIVPLEPTTEMLAAGMASPGYPSDPVYGFNERRGVYEIIYRAPKLRELYRDIVFAIPERSESNPHFPNFKNKLKRP